MVTTINSYTWLIFTVSDDNPIAGCFPLGSHHIFLFKEVRPCDSRVYAAQDIISVSDLPGKDFKV
jgi:hypothetical protein